MDGLGYDPETGRYDDEPEEPEPEPPEPPVVQDEARVRAKISGIESLLRQERFRLDEYLALSDCPRTWIATTQAAVTALEADLASAQRRLPVAPQPRGRRVKHSDARRGQFTGLYNSWRNMIQRCTNPRATEYARYGPRRRLRPALVGLRRVQGGRGRDLALGPEPGSDRQRARLLEGQLPVGDEVPADSQSRSEGAADIMNSTPKRLDPRLTDKGFAALAGPGVLSVLSVTAGLMIGRNLVEATPSFLTRRVRLLPRSLPCFYRAS
jgi:hypothetical protein